MPTVQIFVFSDHAVQSNTLWHSDHTHAHAHTYTHTHARHTYSTYTHTLTVTRTCTHINVFHTLYYPQVPLSP